jgi:Ni/Fe-hydrogenase subunit HybB-like protein
MSWKKPVYIAAAICIGVGLLLMLFVFGSAVYTARFAPGSGTNIGAGLAFMASIAALLAGGVTAWVGIATDRHEKRSGRGPR